MNATPEQFELYTWVDTASGHGMLTSVAGSGKTTSIIESLNYIDDTLPVVVCSFTKLVAEELAKRVKEREFTNVNSTTLNSLGWGLCKENIRGVKLDQFKTDNILRYKLSKSGLDHIEQEKVYRTIKGTIKRVIGLLKSYVVRYSDRVAFDKWIDRILHDFDIDMPEGDSSHVEWATKNFHQLVFEVYKQSAEFLTECDFDDQLFMPVFHGWKGRPAAFIIVDECQDVNYCNIELVKCFMGEGPWGKTRTLWVGDPNQSIYGFRGSLPDACDRIKAEFNCHEMALTICWRCPDLVLKEAQEFVSIIRGPEPNPRGEGIVETIETKEFLNTVRVGDYVICRTSAPLVKRCLELIRRDIPALVKGKDVGRVILGLIDKIEARRPGMNYQEFIKEVQLYKSEQVAILDAAGREEAAIAVSDRCEALEAFCLDNTSVAGVKRKIETLFQDNIREDDVVLFLTGHRCKGLQRKRVFFLRPDMCPHPRAKSENAQIQERNLRYVMVTRSESHLYYVLKERDEK